VRPAILLLCFATAVTTVQAELLVVYAVLAMAFYLVPRGV
jgi:hypothetical protein